MHNDEGARRLCIHSQSQRAERLNPHPPGWVNRIL